MKLLGAVVTLAAALLAACAAAPGHAQSAQDAVIVQARDAYRAKDARQLARLVPQAAGHPLQMWVAYWEQTNRIQDARFDEFRAFARQYPGAYVTDRLRNDWLLELGRRAVAGDATAWADFGSEIGNFVMKDDPQVDCYDLLRRHVGGDNADAAAYAWWMRERGGDGCDAMGEAFVRDGRFTPAQIWQRLRRYVEQDRLTEALRVAGLQSGVADQRLLAYAYSDPLKMLLRTAPTPDLRPYLTLAVLRLARQTPESAAQWLQDHAGNFDADDRAYLWGQVGRTAAVALDDRAAQWYANTGDAALADDVMAWKVRAALRAGDWAQVRATVPRMSVQELQDPAWLYWLGRAYARQGDTDSARVLYEQVASPLSFYGKLALEDLGRKAVLPPEPPPPPPEAVQDARSRPGIARALKLFDLDLRSEAVREWNFALRGLSDAQLHATAEVACDAQIWDRCINTSERIKSMPDMRQRFVMPFIGPIRQAAAAQGMDTAYVLGVIRQESRFVTSARSGAGAGGLMQLMPATARWTARKLGLSLSAGVHDVNTNVSLGTAYLKLLQDEFGGSEALAAAGYNAGPGRPRRWRLGPTVEAAIFAENVPIHETRDYIKRVLSNATVYASLLSGQPQSLKARLGLVGPRPPALGPDNTDLP